MKRQRILVLGAAGFVGRRVVAALAGTDWAVPLAATHRSALPAGTPGEALRVDATDAAQLAQALRQADGVVSCVTGQGGTILDAARALAYAAAGVPPSLRIVHLSSMAAYGSSTGVVDETARLLGDLGEYSAAKRDAEGVLSVVPGIVQLRPGIVYGPGSREWSRMIGRWLLQRRLGDLGEAGRGTCNLVHVDDVAQAAVLALRLPGRQPEAFNLSMPQPPTWNGYFAAYGDALGVPVRRIGALRLRLELSLLAAPLKAVQIAARAARSGRETPEPIRPWLTTLCTHEIRLDVRRAEQQLGMRWKPLPQGLRETADWLRKETGSAAPAAVAGLTNR